MKPFRPMPGIDGVSAGNTATLDCPIGLTYHGILFTMGGTTMNLSLIDEIRVKGNGRDLFTVIGSDLDTHNKFEGRHGAAATQFYLDFERYGLDTAVGPTAGEALRGRELTAIGTGIRASENNPIELSTLQIEIDINSSASSPTLSAKAVQSGARPLGLLKKRRRFNYNTGGAGEYEISDLPRGDLIDKIYIHNTSGDYTTRVKLERDNFLAFDRTPNENNLVQLDGRRVPQSQLFVIDPSERGRGDEAIQTANVSDLRLKITTSATSSLRVYIDYLGAFSGN